MLHTRQRTNHAQRIAFLTLTVLLIGFALLSYQSRAARVNTSNAPPLPAPTCVPPPPNMTLWLPGDGDAKDLVDSNHGTLQNGALANGAGKVGQAFSLDGIDDYVSVANAPELNVGTGDFSMDAWIKTNCSGLQTDRKSTRLNSSHIP